MRRRPWRNGSSWTPQEAAQELHRRRRELPAGGRQVFSDPEPGRSSGVACRRSVYRPSMPSNNSEAETLRPLLRDCTWEYVCPKLPEPPASNGGVVSIGVSAPTRCSPARC